MENYSSIRASKKGVASKSCSCSSSDETCSDFPPSCARGRVADLKGIKWGKAKEIKRAKDGPLVTTTKSQSAPLLINDLREQLEEAVKLGFAKYLLQSIVKKLLPKNRVCNCLSRVLSKENGVTVHQSKEHGKCFYGNLSVCSSLWLCPVCAMKISERRKKELALLLERHRDMRGYTLLVTFTFPHKYRDALPELLKMLRDAMRRNKSSRAAQKVRKLAGLIGTVRALEVTHGKRNGWHPHIHELWLLDGSVPESEAIETLKDELYGLWSKACIRSGLPKPSKRHGLDVRNGDYADKYVSKWGLESELTKAHTKKGRGGNCTPWDFLRDIFLTEDQQSKLLFREYAKAFKGQRQLVWSRGLKALYEIEDKKDAEIVREQDDQADFLGRIAFKDWLLILKHEVRGQLLHIGTLGGWEAIKDLIDDLREHDIKK